MKVYNPENRLFRAWGAVDKKHISLVSAWVMGESVLDLGCGFGSTTSSLSLTHGVQCIGVDHDSEMVNIAKRLFPACEYHIANAERLPFPNEAFDTVILRDSLHHLHGEADFPRVRSEILRVSKRNARLIILDPTVNFLMKCCRKIAFHKDEECSHDMACEIMNEMGYEMIYDEYNTVISLPLSGGYVGVELVPPWPWLYRAVMKADQLAEDVIGFFGLGRYLCWRYLLVGTRRDSR